MKRLVLLLLACLLCAVTADAITVTTQVKGDVTSLDNTSELRGWLNLWLTQHLSLTARGYVQDPNTTAVEGLVSLNLGRWTVSGGAEYLIQQERTYAEVAISYQTSLTNFLTLTGYFNAEPDQAVYELEGAFEIPTYKSLSTYITSKTRYFAEGNGLTTERATLGLLFPVWRRDSFVLKLNPYGGYALTNPAPDDAATWHGGVQIISWTY